jgi:hypothetical protein
MKRATLAAVVGVSLLTALAPPAKAQSSITEQEAHAIGVDAYLYFYPLVTIDITRRVATNVEAGRSAIAQDPRFATPKWPTDRFKNFWKD